MAKIVIFGTGQMAEIVYHYFKYDSEHEVVAFCCDRSFLEEDHYLGLPVVAFEDVLPIYPPNQFNFHVALSYNDMNRTREKKYHAVKSLGYNLVSYVSTKTGSVGPITHGDNCLILENISIQPGVCIGNNVAIFGNALLGHHTRINDHAWITSEVALAGNVTIGSRCFLGINATISHFVTIGDGCFIGAGSLVNKPVNPNSVIIQRETELYPLDVDRFLKITKML